MAVPAGHPERPQGVDGRAMLERMNTGAHEQLANWGLERLDVLGGAAVLDIGCGGGANLGRILALADDVHVTGVDYSPLAVNMSREVNARAIDQGRCVVKAGSVDALPFDDGAFDAATAFETVYFWPDMEASLAEVRRVLKNGGLFLVCNEANGQTADANEVAQQIEGMTIYNADELRSMLEAASFEVLEVEDEGDAGRICVVARSL